MQDKFDRAAFPSYDVRSLPQSPDAKMWHCNGILHREDGPAVEYPDGTEEWWLHGLRHRENGPAVTLPNGFKAWWVNGQLHRPDGPAVEYPDGSKEWWLHGIPLDQSKSPQNNGPR